MVHGKEEAAVQPVSHWLTPDMEVMADIAVGISQASALPGMAWPERDEKEEGAIVFPDNSP